MFFIQLRHLIVTAFYKKITDCTRYLISLSPLITTAVTRVVNSDFRMGGDWSPPIGGGLKGGDKGPMGGEWRVIRDIFWQ